MREIPCVFMRGGVCKGAVFHERDLPPDQEERDRIFIQVIGAPDPKQADGLGCGVSSNNKIVIISPSKREGIDIDYTTAQVVPGKRQVDYQGACGNMTSAVGSFAIDEGLVKAVEPFTHLRLFNINTEKIIEVKVPVKDGQAVYQGGFHFDGIPGTAAPIPLTFKHPAGSIGKGLLPTGKAIDTLDIPGHGPFEATIIDAATPLVVVRAEDLGLKGTELPAEFNNLKETIELIRKIRGLAAVKIGLVDNWEEAEEKSPGSPKISFFSAAEDYKTMDGNLVSKSEIDFCSRVISLQKMHTAYVFVSAIAMAVAANLPGSILQKSLTGKDVSKLVRMGHPSGVMPMGVELNDPGKSFEAVGVTLTSTTRKIMKGHVFVD